MNFTNDFLQKLDEKQERNIVFANYYYRMHKSLKQDRYLKKYHRVKDCCTFWKWDAYHQNKILDLQHLNRCDDRNCPNCRSFNVAKTIHNFRPAFGEMIKKGYLPMFMTLTVPNVSGQDLKHTIKNMQNAFRQLNKWLNLDTKEGCKDRLFTMKACVKVLEINVQKTNHDMYHPHYHCIIFIDANDYTPYSFEKFID